MPTLLLIHGGLWEDIDAERFWRRPAVVAALESRGYDVLAPDRLVRAPSWAAEADHLAAAAGGVPVTVVAGSNGCSVGVRLALRHPTSVERLVLAWPATAGDERVDAAARRAMTAQGATPETIADLLSGQTLRGVTDAELARLPQRVGVLPSAPENPFHQRRTVDALLRLVPGAEELPGTPESPRPEFPAYLETFVAAIS